MIFRKFPTEVLLKRFFLNSSEISRVESLARTSRCSFEASSGEAIIKKRLVGLPSRLSKSMPSFTIMAASPGFFTPALFACGTATPSPKPVETCSSRRNTSFLYNSLSLKQPLLFTSSTSSLMACSLLATVALIFIQLGSSKSQILIICPQMV